MLLRQTCLSRPSAWAWARALAAAPAPRPLSPAWAAASVLASGPLALQAHDRRCPVVAEALPLATLLLRPLQQRLLLARRPHLALALALRRQLRQHQLGRPQPQALINPAAVAAEASATHRCPLLIWTSLASRRMRSSRSPSRCLPSTRASPARRWRVRHGAAQPVQVRRLQHRSMAQRRVQPAQPPPRAPGRLLLVLQPQRSRSARSSRAMRLTMAPAAATAPSLPPALPPQPLHPRPFPSAPRRLGCWWDRQAQVPPSLRTRSQPASALDPAAAPAVVVRAGRLEVPAQVLVPAASALQAAAVGTAALVGTGAAARPATPPCPLRT